MRQPTRASATWESQPLPKNTLPWRVIQASAAIRPELGTVRRGWVQSGGAANQNGTRSSGHNGAGPPITSRCVGTNSQRGYGRLRPQAVWPAAWFKPSSPGIVSLGALVFGGQSVRIQNSTRGGKHSAPGEIIAGLGTAGGRPRLSALIGVMSGL